MQRDKEKIMFAEKVCKRFTEKELFELPIEEKLSRMSIPQTVAQVAAECDIAFCEYCRFVEQLETINVDDPFRAALDHARENDVTCFVQYGKYYGKVPSFKRDMKGWVDAFKVYDQMRMEQAVGKG